MNKRKINDETKYVSKYYLKKEMDIIMNELYGISEKYKLYKEIKTKDFIDNVCKEIPHTFNIIIQSLFNQSLMDLAKLVVDKGNNDITINDIIKKYETHNYLFREQKYRFIQNIETGKKKKLKLENKSIADAMNQLKNDLRKHEEFISFLSKKRRKSMAHNDKKITFDKKNKYYYGKLTYEDINKCIEDLTKDMNQIYYVLYNTNWQFLYNTTDEIDYMLSVFKKKQKELKKAYPL